MTKTSATPARRAGPPVDATLPEKQRARRRLVGAVAFALTAGVGLSMTLDDEPRPVNEDIVLRVPSREPVAPPQPAAEERAGAPASAADAPVPASRTDAAAAPASGGAAMVAGAAALGAAGAAAVLAPPPDSAAPPAAAPAKPAEAKVAEAKSAEAKSAAPKAVESKPTTAKTAEHKGGDHKGTESKSVALKPSDPKAADSKPAETRAASARVADGKSPAKGADTRTAEARARGADKAPESRPADKPADKPAARTAELKRSKPGDDDPIGRLAESRDPARQSARKGGYYVQAGAYATERGAAGTADRLRDAGHKVHTERVTTDKGERTRVRLGPYPDRESAQRARDQLKARGVEGAIVAP